MKPLLFIHGTGTRRASYDETLAVVQRRVGIHLDGYQVKECYWGEPYGSTSWLNSVPRCPTQQEIEQAEQIKLWQRLLEDPFYQLRLMEAITGPDDSVSFSDSPGAKRAPSWPKTTSSHSGRPPSIESSPKPKTAATFRRPNFFGWVALSTP